MFLSHGSGRLSTFVSNVYNLGGVTADSSILPTVAGSGHIPFFYSPTRVYCFTAPVPDQSMSHRSPLIFETCVGGGDSRSISAPPQRPDTRLLEKCQLPRCRLSESPSCTPSPLLRLVTIFEMSGNAYFLLLRFNCRLRLITVAICARSEHYNNAYECEFLTRLRPSTMK